MRRAAWVTLVITLGVALGCGGGAGTKRHRVTGTVSYKQKPLAGGSIDFIPEAGDRGETVSTGIRDGKFEFSGSNGVPAGKYKVSISAGYSGEAPNPSGDQKGGSPVQQIPEKYNARTTLRAEVTPDGKNEFSFDDLK